MGPFYLFTGEYFQSYCYNFEEFGEKHNVLLCYLYISPASQEVRKKRSCKNQLSLLSRDRKILQKLQVHEADSMRVEAIIFNLMQIGELPRHR